MANFEDELLLDAELDAQEVAYIREQLSEEMAAHFDEEDLYYLIDLIASYYAESGVLDAEPDSDGFINLPLDAIVEYLQKTASRELQKDFPAEAVAAVVEADMDFAEAND